ncbi:hypothetical protein BABINDRAFT_159632 [Babjeviella inositovora NRRL Y-12698]|uniref:Structural maintenance of chromosomes protein n=1 Tax=Babjeviella inositovora NRRL Y-12698 TaxID=984486 RepID=A0A1E3R1F0_9ASCO|nr:uncharacterized protein BABINDRAFT_159632 [Babjeviella inositovora NRRL Y-12698]ODQ83192.1 hypothetical protein BABINDRAFT_159632 [Babjeviella inositovora NRRL Y-12698]
MGRLVGLELHNFKSYRGTTKVGFGTSYFTSIIGPNGAGKSNMMDAISFVLGVRSQNLRSANVKDMIYRGRVMNDELDDKVPKSAYVMAIYEKANGEVLKLKRTITQRNSAYTVNGESVSSAVYANLLKEENILIKARNFLVFQGDVEQIASQSARDLTNLLETVSGSVEDVSQYDTRREAQERARETSSTLFARKRALNSELKQYREQAVEGASFKAKLADRANLVTLMNVHKAYHNEQQHHRLAADIAEGQNALSALRAKLDKEESVLRVLTTEYAKRAVLAEKQKKQGAKTRLQLEEKRRALIPVGVAKDALTKKIRDYQRRIAALLADVRAQTKTITGYEAQLKTVQRALKQFEAAGVTTVLSGEGQEEYEQLKERLLSTAEGSQHEDTINLLADERENLAAQLAALQKQKALTTARIAELAHARTQTSAKCDDATARCNETMELLESKKLSLQQLVEARDRLTKQEYDLGTQLREVLVALDELNADARESAREKKLRENVASLRRLFPGVKGLVHDLCQPKQKKYEVAVATLLGKNFDAVVVDTLSTATKCIEYLKEQRAGVASFIPLDRVEARAPHPSLRALHADATPALDVIEYDAPFERAVQYAVSDAIVCSTMEVARYVKWERNIDVKVVTLDGSLIHKAGLMTGGRTKLERRWNKNEAAELGARKEELQTALATLQTSKPSEVVEKQVRDDISDLLNQLPVLRATRAELERAVQDRDAEISYQETTAKEHATEEKAVASSLKALDKKTVSVESKIETLQTEIFGEFCRKHGFRTIREYELTHGNYFRARAKERAVFVKQTAVLENKLMFERERHQETEARLVRLGRDKEGLDESFKELLAAQEALQSEIDLLESEIEVNHEETTAVAEDLAGKLRFSKSVEARVMEYKAEFHKLESQLRKLNEDLLKQDVERVNHLKNCKIENVELPLLRGDLAQVAIGEDASTLVVAAYAVEIDYTLLSERLRAHSRAGIEAEFTEKLALLAQELELMTPNSKANDRLTDVEHKLLELEQAFVLARAAEVEATAAFNSVKELRYAAFMEAFVHISGKIDSIYKELTKSASSPLGGSAFLTLEDEDEPYNAGVKYHAMPPMKRFRDMELLSGGEKTIAALALLFAVHSYHPSPFFVLDEVDAALDNSNVNKIANYISTNAGPNFQFIVISLKNSLFERSDALVGIYREQNENSSKTVTMDLREYPTA